MIGAGATIDFSGTYRYVLWRSWDQQPRLGFVMLNPSTVDATQAPSPALPEEQYGARLLVRRSHLGGSDLLAQNQTG